jgi:hypothetical protein
MRLLSLDYSPVYEPAVLANFSGDDSVFDFDVVVWNPPTSFFRYTYSYSYSQTYRNLPSLGEDKSVSIASDSERRRQEFLEFIEAGRTLVVFVAPPQECYIDTGERTYSGTGRNRVKTTHVSQFDLLQAIPLSTMSFKRASGSEIEIVGSGPISGLLRKYEEYLSYSAVIKDPPGTVLARVSGTDRAISSLVKVKGGGVILFSPGD